MKKIKYVGNSGGGVTVVSGGRSFITDEDGFVDVPDPTATSLLRQKKNWAQPTPPTPKSKKETD